MSFYGYSDEEIREMAKAKRDGLAMLRLANVYSESEIMAAMAEFYRRSSGDEITPEDLLYHLRREK